MTRWATEFYEDSRGKRAFVSTGGEDRGRPAPAIAFYLFTQGEHGGALKWAEGTIHPTAQWEGTAGFKLTF